MHVKTLIKFGNVSVTLNVYEKMKNSVFIHKDLRIDIALKNEHGQSGYTRVNIKNLSKKIVHVKYGRIFWKKKFASFMVSNVLINRRGKSAEDIVLEYLFYNPEKFYLVFNGTSKELQEELNLVASRNVRIT